MEVVRQSAAVDFEADGKAMMRNIEKAGRTCYKSEDKATEDSADAFVRRIIKSGHESVLEHEKVSMRLVCDRGVSHEVVRHRLVSYSQESTRYCDYGKKGVVFVEPGSLLTTAQRMVWENAMREAELSYLTMRDAGASPQMARSVLPNSLKTEMVMTANLREWRHFCRLRTSKAAHPQMRELAALVLKALRELVPVVFEDIPEPEA